MLTPLQHQEIIKAQILKSYSNGDLAKSNALVGEVHTWKDGKRYRKTLNGWEPAEESKLAEKKEEIKNSKIDFSKMSEEEYNKIYDNAPLKSGQCYFLRYTENPELDLKRGTSVHLTNHSSMKEAKKDNPDAEYVKTENGDIGMLINGLAAYEVGDDFEEVDDAIDDAEGSVTYNLKQHNSNASFDKNRIPVLFKGRYVENDDMPDGVTFKPISIVKRLGWKHLQEMK